MSLQYLLKQTLTMSTCIITGRKSSLLSRILQCNVSLFACPYEGRDETSK